MHRRDDKKKHVLSISQQIVQQILRLWDIFIWLHLNRRWNWYHSLQAALEKREWKAQNGKGFIIWGAWTSSVRLTLNSSNVLWRSLESNRTLNIYRGVHADLSVQKNIWRIRLMIQEFRNHLRNMFKILKVEQRKHRIQGRGLPNNESRQLHNSEPAVSRVWANKSTLIGQFSKCFVFRSNTLEVFNYLFIFWGTTTCCRNLENG